MPNRVIRDGVLDSQRYHDVDKPARLAFLELLLCCDDYGLVPLSDVYLKRHTTAFESVSRTAADGILSALIDRDLLRMYEIDGARYGYIPRFGNVPRSKKPKWPLPPDQLGGNEIKHLVQKMQSRCSASAGHLRTFAPETGTETETGTVTAKDASEPLAAAAGAAAAKAPRASRKCPASFLVEGELQRWARAEVPAVDIRAETAKMRDHTFRTAMTDWPATWRNWMRKANDELARRPGGSLSAKEKERERKRKRLAVMTGGLLGAESVGASGDIFEMGDAHGPRLSHD